MKLTQEEELKLRLLSDGEFYSEAVAFIREHRAVVTSQIEGLENIAAASDSLAKILAFVNNQANKEGRDYENFYKALKKKLQEFKTNLAQKYAFIPQELLIEPAGLNKAAKKQRQQHIENYEVLAAREFIHHLAAENRYRSEKKE